MSYRNPGLLLRVFSPKPELVAANVSKVMATIDLAAKLKENKQQVFSRVDVLVPMDTRYKDSDLGETAPVLRERLNTPESDASDDPSHPFPIQVHSVREGDIFCGLLNFGVEYQMEKGVSHSMILSVDAREYLTKDNMDLMITALSYDARVTGLAIAELKESILLGRIANTCAIWDNVALKEVGGFDLMARQALVGEIRPNAGVEEIPPLLRIVDKCGECLAPVSPVAGAVWHAPTDPDVLARHTAKMMSKYERQLAHAQALGHPDLELLGEGVMENYRTF